MHVRRVSTVARWRLDGMSNPPPFHFDHHASMLRQGQVWVLYEGRSSKPTPIYDVSEIPDQRGESRMPPAHLPPSFKQHVWSHRSPRSSILPSCNLRSVEHRVSILQKDGEARILAQELHDIQVDLTSSSKPGLGAGGKRRLLFGCQISIFAPGPPNQAPVAFFLACCYIEVFFRT